MKFSELNFLKLLKSFSEAEIIEFEKFICSPFFNTQNTIISLFRELLRFYPDFSNNDLTKEKIFYTVFPGKEYNDTLLRKYISNLMKLAEDYLIYKDVFGNKDKKMISLLDQYDSRNLTPFFEKQLRKMEKDSGENSKITVETFYFKHFREELKSGYYIRINKIYEIKSCLIRSQIYILMHLLMTNTVYTNMMLIVQRSYKDTTDNDYFEKFNEVFDLISYLENINFNFTDQSEKLFISLCKIDLELMKEPHNIEKLKLMKIIILEISDILSDNLLYTFFSHLNIFYMLNITENNPELKRDVFENYKFMIDKDLYNREGNGYINYSEYRSILNISLRVKEIEWLENFIYKFKDLHEPEMRYNIFSYSQALLDFEKKNYDSSLRYISKIKISDVVMKLDVDILLLMIFYERNYVDNALSLIDSHRHYLNEEKYLSGNSKENHLNFLKYYRILLLKKNSNNVYENLKDLEYEILNNNNLKRKEWLLEVLKNELN